MSFCTPFISALSDEERDNLNGLIQEAYNDNQAELGGLLEPYGLTNADNLTKMSELHSFIGTQIDDLPQNLENHYKLYFKDRQIVLELSKGQPTPPHADTKPPEFKPLPTATEPAPQPAQPAQPAPQPAQPPQHAELVAYGAELLIDLKANNDQFRIAINSCDYDAADTLDVLFLDISTRWDTFLARAPEYGASLALDAKEEELRQEWSLAVTLENQYYTTCWQTPLLAEIFANHKLLIESYKRQQENAPACNYDDWFLENDLQIELYDRGLEIFGILNPLYADGRISYPADWSGTWESIVNQRANESDLAESFWQIYCV